MSSHRRPTIPYELALLGVAAIWGLNFPVVKWALRDVGPLLFNAVRFTLSVSFLGLLTLRSARGNSSALPPFRPTLLMGLAGLGLLGHFLYQVLFIEGLERTTSGNAAFLISSAPIWTAVIGRFFFGSRLRASDWLGLTVAFGGAALLITARAGLSFSADASLGNLMAFGGAIAWGGYTVVSGRFLDELSPTALAFWTMLVAVPLLWMMAFLEGFEFGWASDPRIWAALLYSGLLSTGLAYVLWNLGIKHVGAAQTAVFANLVPIVALVVGVVWLGEAPHLSELAGAALIIGGLLVMRLLGRSVKPST